MKRSGWQSWRAKGETNDGLAKCVLACKEFSARRDKQVFIVFVFPAAERRIFRQSGRLFHLVS